MHSHSQQDGWLVYVFQWCAVWNSERLHVMRRLCYDDLQTPTSSLRHYNCPTHNDDVTQPLPSDHFNFSDASRSSQSVNHALWPLPWLWPWPWYRVPDDVCVEVDWHFVVALGVIHTLAPHGIQCEWIFRPGLHVQIIVLIILHMGPQYAVF